MSHPKEMINRIVADEACWLHAQTKGLMLEVRSSIGLRDSDPLYQPVLALLRASPHHLVERFELLDASFMYGKVQVTTWRFDD